LSGQKGQPSTLAQTHARIQAITTCGFCRCGTVLIDINISHLLSEVVTVDSVIDRKSAALQRRAAFIAVSKEGDWLSAIRWSSGVGLR